MGRCALRTGKDQIGHGYAERLTNKLPSEVGGRGEVLDDRTTGFRSVLCTFPTPQARVLQYEHALVAAKSGWVRVRLGFK